MSARTPNTDLLPSGFEDLLPPQAETEYRAIGTLMKHFARFGYRRIKPPMAEFEESLLAEGPGSALAQSTFRLMDPASHRMMALRSDITAQIARIAQTRLADAPRPLRVTYANDVIRTRASQQRTLRQFAQVGCEMIGVDSAASDIEIAGVAISGLAALKIRNVTFDFAIPRLMDTLFAAYKLPEAMRPEVLQALRSRSEDALGLVPSKALKVLLGALLHISGPAGAALKALKALDLPRAAAEQVERLEAVIKGAQTILTQLEIDTVTLSLDPLESRGFEYQKGVTFTVFAKGARGEIGRGGRYEIFRAGQTVGSAAGFTFYMDTLRQAIGDEKPHKCICVAGNESWAVIQNLQKQGWVVLRALEDKIGGKSGAEISDSCTHVYKNGKIEDVK